jgi:hypothetical protein
MQRRTVLSAVAAGSLAGCLTGASGLPARDGSVTGSTDDGDADGTPAWDACPSFVEDADRTVCWTDRGDAEVYLAPSSRTFAESETYQSVDTVTFTLHNGGDGEVRLNPYDWAVMRHTAGGWTHLAPDGAIPQPLLVVDAGDSHEWRLATTEHPSGRVENRRDVVADLPAEGSYAFRLHGWLGPVEESVHVEWVARFEYVRSDEGSQSNRLGGPAHNGGP